MMRYSCREDDAGFANFIKARPVRVLIDGVERGNVITADEDRRQALCTMRDERGRLVVDIEQRCIKTEWITGTVVVLPVNN